jgi:hypothetical protein
MSRIVGNSGRVYAVEPHPGNFELLRTNVARNGFDDCAELKRPIDFLHMDVEGYEVEILRSLAEQAGEGSGRLYVLFETHPEFYDTHYNDIRPVLDEL